MTLVHRFDKIQRVPPLLKEIIMINVDNKAQYEIMFLVEILF